jgi:hypothetical protein
MLIRIIRQPLGSLNGVSLRGYKLDRCYDVEASLGDYLVVNGYAFIEMRKDDCEPAPVDVPKPDRRRRTNRLDG